AVPGGGQGRRAGALSHIREPVGGRAAPGGRPRRAPALRRGPGDLPRGRPLRHLLHRPHRSRTDHPHSFRWPQSDSGRAGAGGDVRRALDVRRRGPLGHGGSGRGDDDARPARARHQARPTDPPRDCGEDARSAGEPPARRERKARPPVLPAGRRARGLDAAGPGRGAARRGRGGHRRRGRRRRHTAGGDRHRGHPVRHRPARRLLAREREPLSRRSRAGRGGDHRSRPRGGARPRGVAPLHLL
ncbi:MAG: cAMP-binding proteins - catabolite gene activator and regulatory subunit of cAMP-dependent protein kinases, partial [uncultured Solirubrobacterales bacterium]